jgi:hypothetical protein
MIFAAWAILWIMTMDSPRLLAIPVLALLVRALYLDRRLLVRGHRTAFITAVGIFLYLVTPLGGMAASSAGLTAIRILLSSFILIHIGQGFGDIHAPLFGSTFGTMYIAYQRCLAMERVMVRDAFYTFAVRWRVGWNRRHVTGFTPMTVERGHLMLGLIKTVVSSLIALNNEVQRLHRARGQVAISSGWTVPRARKVPVFLGDLALVFLATGTVWVLGRAGGEILILLERFRVL